MMESRSPGRFFLTGLLLAGMVLFVAGCDRAPKARFVDDQRVYTLAQAGENAAGVPAGTAADVDVEDAAEVRERTLTALRREGDPANEAADVLTAEFPAVTKAVPYYVEAATIDGRPCWIFLEAWGGRTGKLTFRRMWVFDRETKAIVESRRIR